MTPEARSHTVDYPKAGETTLVCVHALSVKAFVCCAVEVESGRVMKGVMCEPCFQLNESDLTKVFVAECEWPAGLAFTSARAV